MGCVLARERLAKKSVLGEPWASAIAVAPPMPPEEVPVMMTGSCVN